MPVINLRGTPTYQGEVLLLGWSENNRDGMTVRLALDGSDEGAAHPFRSLGTGKHGQRFMAVLVPLGDDEQPVVAEPVKAAAKPAAERDPWDSLPYAKQAGMTCNEPEFWRFLEARAAGRVAVRDADRAASELRHICGVQTRKEFDADPHGPAAERWRTLHGEFKRWRSDRVGQEQAEAQARAYRR